LLSYKLIEHKTLRLHKKRFSFGPHRKLRFENVFL
jgi:hypothetical protein